MKKIAFLIILIFCITFLQAQPVFTKDQQAVQQTIIKFFESLSNRDSLSLKNYCTADITLIEYGSIWNVDTLIRKAIKLNTTIDFKRINTLDFISTTINGNTAWTTYRLYSDITRDGKQTKIQWLETVVAVKERKRWKIKILHSTLTKRS